MSTSSAPRFDQATLDDIRAREPLSAIFERFGHRLRKAGRVRECLCPFTPRRPRAARSTTRRGCSSATAARPRRRHRRGDEVSRLHLPGGGRVLGGAREITELDRKRLEKQRETRETRAAERQRTVLSVERLLGECRPIRGTRVDDYLTDAASGPPPTRPGPALPPEPALSRLRLARGRGRGSPRPLPGDGRADPRPGLGDGHRPAPHLPRPGRAGEAEATGDTRRNRAKKDPRRAPRRIDRAFDAVAPHGLRRGDRERPLSWRALGYGAEEGYGLASLVSLGNMAGSATGSIPHPTLIQDDGRPRAIPNGIPTRAARVRAAGRRDRRDPDRRRRQRAGRDPDAAAHRRPALRRRGGRTWAVHMAPEDLDFNDALLRDLG